MKTFTLNQLVTEHAARSHGFLPSDSKLTAMKGEPGFLLHIGTQRWTAAELRAVAAELESLDAVFPNV